MLNSISHYPTCTNEQTSSIPHAEIPNSSLYPIHNFRDLPYPFMHPRFPSL